MMRPEEPDATRAISPMIAWITVATLFLAQIVSTIDRGMLALVVDPVRRDLSISEMQIALLQGFAFSIFYVTVGLPLGAVADVVNRRRLLIGGIVVWSAATIAGGFAQGFGSMFASRLFIGVGEAVLGPCAVTMISDLFPPHRRGRPMALYVFGSMIAYGLGSLVSGVILDLAPKGVFAGLPIIGGLAPWRIAFALVGASGLLIVILLFLLREPATWIAIAAGAFDPLVGAMLAGLAVTMIFREPFIGVVNAWLQSMTYSKPQLVASMAAALAKAALVWLLVRAAAAPARFSWLWALEAAAIGLALLLYYRQRNGGTLGWTFDNTLFRHFATAGTIFWLGLICMYLFLKLDRLMLERHVSFADLGRYAAAQQLNENWITLALMLAQTIAPAFVYRVQDAARLRRNIVRLTAMTAGVMTAGALVLDAAAPLIVGKVFGPGYEASVDIFRWAVWLSVPAGIEAIGNLIVLKYQAKFVLLLKWVLALAIAALVNLIAIPRLGLYGALVGLAGGYLAAAAVNFYYIRYKLRP